ncbi:MAG: hypothetical protein MZU97_16210 [Bacillus subtilis]|nr:hypothetical protein [Bacillus subtilis]
MKQLIQGKEPKYFHTMPISTAVEAGLFEPYLERGKLVSISQAIQDSKTDFNNFDRIGYWG